MSTQATFNQLLLLLSSSASTTIAISVPVLISSTDSAVGTESILFERSIFDYGTGLETSAKVANEFGSGVDIFNQILIPSVDSSNSQEVISYLYRMVSQIGSASETSVITALLSSLEHGATVETSQYAEALPPDVIQSGQNKQILTNIETTLSTQVRGIGGEVRASDIMNIRNYLLVLAQSILPKVLDIDKVQEVIAMLNNLNVKSGDLVLAEHRNTLSDAMYKLLLAIESGRRFEVQDEGATGEESSLTKDATSLFNNLYLVSDACNQPIYMNSANVIWNKYLPPSYSQPTPPDYVFDIEDTCPLSQADKDYEDVVLVVWVKPDQVKIIIDVWQGEHGANEYVYWKGELLVKIPPRSAPKYQFQYVGTFERPYP